ncbi:MAG: gamma-glutamyltransferase [Anaerolineae bacterium]
MKGVIAAGDPQTAAAGAEILAQGGNAVDAAVAAAFASFVAEAVLVNIGGGGVALVVDGSSGQATVYDFFSDMPSGRLAGQADFRQVLVDFGAEQQPFYIGRASVAVPGVVAGLAAMAETRGALPLDRLLRPAVRLAREGVVLSEALAYVLKILSPIFTDTPPLAAMFTRNGRVYRAGERLCFPALAETLTRLGREGPAQFYTGAVGQQIVADQQAHGGLLTARDLAAYRVRQMAPIRLDYRGYTVLLPPPPSSGGVLIAFALKLLEAVDLQDLSPTSFEHARLLAETMRLANAARKTWETNVGSDEARVERFLAEEHLNRYRRELVHSLKRGPSPDRSRAGQRGGPGNTTHISVVDGQGGVAGVTTSAGENAGFVVGDSGVCLNNMLGEIDLHPDGFHRLPPGVRLTTMMSPAIVLRDGRPVLAVGSGGSNRLRSAIVQVISNALDFQMPLQQAIDAPRLHFEDGLLQAEGGVPAPVVAELRRAGYQVNHWPGRNMFFGGAHAVARQGEGLLAAGDRRRGGSVAVVD